MALDYPEVVPERFRFRRPLLEAEYGIGRFVDIAPQLGINTFNLCGGVIVEDFDVDGNLDIVTSTYDPRGPLVYYHNLGNGQFEDRSAKSRLDQQLGGLNCIGADYDNDGDTDTFLSCAGRGSSTTGGFATRSCATRATARSPT